MKQYYPSSKILFDVAKIQKYLLAPGKPHYKEFYDVGYRRKDDVKLFLDIESQYDIQKAVVDRKYQDGSIGFHINMMLGVTKKRPFITCWAMAVDIPLARFVTAYRIGVDNNV